MVVERRAEVITLCKLAIENAEDSVRDDAILALCKYATKEDAPYLIQVLGESTENKPARENDQIIHTLGRLATPDSIEAIAWLGHVTTRSRSLTSQPAPNK